MLQCARGVLDSWSAFAVEDELEQVEVGGAPAEVDALPAPPQTATGAPTGARNCSFADSAWRRSASSLQTAGPGAPFQ